MRNVLETPTSRHPFVPLTTSFALCQAHWLQIGLCTSLLTLPLLMDGRVLHIGGFILLMFLLWLLLKESAATSINLARQWLAAPIIAYLGYVWLSDFWSDPLRVGRLFEDLGKFVNIIGFVAAVAILRRRKPEALSLVEVLFTATATLVAVIAIARFVSHAEMSRLKGFGTGENEIVAGMLFSVAVLFLIGKFLNKPQHRLVRWIGAAAVITLIAAVFLTKSRGPIAALFVTVGVLCILDARYRWPLVLTLGAVAAVLFGTGLLSLNALLERGFSYRFELWQLSLELAAQKPLWGHGAASQLTYVMADGTTLSFSHNVLLSTLVFGGAIGLALLITLLGMLLASAWRARSSPDRFTLLLLAFGVLCGLTDRQIDLQNLSPEYLYLWYPAGILLGRLADPDRRQGS